MPRLDVVEAQIKGHPVVQGVGDVDHDSYTSFQDLREAEIITIIIHT